MQAFYLQVRYFLALKTRTNGFCFTCQYKNVKADVSSWLVSLLARDLTVCSFVQYLSAVWNVINFEEAETRFAEAV
jgi:hypothetical protein